MKQYKIENLNMDISNDNTHSFSGFSFVYRQSFSKHNKNKTHQTIK